MLLTTILLALFAGFAAFVGALIGLLSDKKPRWLGPVAQHSITSFGGGALVSAICFVLVPDGMALQSPSFAIVSFILGGITFLFVDKFLALHNSPTSQIIALMLDFVPEAIALGAMILHDFKKAIFMAIIIAAQNLPEGFSAYKEVSSESNTSAIKKHILLIIALLALSGPIYALFGYYIFDAQNPSLGTLMTFCAGGILYLVFKDVAPQAQLQRHWLPSFGAVLGFALGMLGHALTS